MKKTYPHIVPMLTKPAIAAGSLAGQQPEIAADDLLLRPWQPADGPAVVAAYDDEALQRWHCWTMTDDEALEWIASWAKRWQSESAASWAVVEAGQVAGQIGLRRIDLNEAQASVSYWVVPAARGRRIAPRALTAMSTWAFGTLGLHRLELSHATANQPSCRVAQLAGFAAEGTKRSEALHADGWHDMHLHARLASDR
jgi:RimJ/RimL family protein N-acetyltransferase